MNYRHAYHAGNHADVLKHIVLTRVLAALNRKDKPYRVIDAHAGVGVYALDGIEAGKTREWEGGVGKMAAPFAPEVEALLAHWREGVAALNPGVDVSRPGRDASSPGGDVLYPGGDVPYPGGDVLYPGGALRAYPGSPEIAARMMRPADRLIANELHPEDGQRLAAHFRRDRRVKVLHLDSEACIKATLPPPERRGVVLIDPPYEAKNEAARAARTLAEGVARFAGGVFLLWYPVKGRGEEADLLAVAKALGVPGTLAAELRVREAFKEGGLAGSGLIVVNAPWKLDEELGVILPVLASRLGVGAWGDGKVNWITAPI